MNSFVHHMRHQLTAAVGLPNPTCRPPVWAQAEAAANSVDLFHMGGRLIHGRVL